MTMKGGRSKKKRADTFDGSLTGLVFSWSLNDIFNEKLYKDKVAFFPQSFLFFSGLQNIIELNIA